MDLGLAVFFEDTFLWTPVSRAVCMIPGIFILGQLASHSCSGKIGSKFKTLKSRFFWISFGQNHQLHSVPHPKCWTKSYWLNKHVESFYPKDENMIPPNLTVACLSDGKRSKPPTTGWSTTYHLVSGWNNSTYFGGKKNKESHFLRSIYRGPNNSIYPSLSVQPVLRVAFEIPSSISMELQPHKIGEIPTHLLGKNWCLGWMSSMTPYFFVVLHMFLTLLASGSRIEAFQFFLWFVLLVIFFTDSTMGWQSPLNLNHHLGNQSIQVVILVGWFHKTIMFQSKFWVEKVHPTKSLAWYPLEPSKKGSRGDVTSFHFVELLCRAPLIVFDHVVASSSFVHEPIRHYLEDHRN